MEKQKHVVSRVRDCFKSEEIRLAFLDRKHREEPTFSIKFLTMKIVLKLLKYAAFSIVFVSSFYTLSISLLTTSTEGALNDALSNGIPEKITAKLKPPVTRKLLMEWQRSYRRNGLGNQLFLYASLLGLATRNQFQPIIPDYSPILSLLKSPFSATVVSSAVYDSLVKNATEIAGHEIHEAFCCTYFKYTEKLNSVSDDQDVVLHGAFQSWNYFYPEFKDVVAREFVFREDIIVAAKRVLDGLLLHDMPHRPRIGIHIRRGDILKSHLKHFGHVPAPKSYFDSAIQWMTNRHPDALFVVISNDFPWAQKNILKDGTVFAPTNLSPEVSMALLTMMDHLILSVGTFSWWSAYLSRAQDVVYYNGTPTPLSFYDVTFRTEDYFLPHWTGIG